MSRVPLGLCSIIVLMTSTPFTSMSFAIPLNGAESSPQDSVESSDGERLALGDILRRLDASHPKLNVAREGERSALAAERSASGVWNPLLKLSASSHPVSAYERMSLSSEVRQATPLWGADLFAGYRVTSGEIPIYKEELRTLAAGEVSAGVDIQLLAGRALDKRRALINSRSELRRSATAQLEYQRVLVERDAALAYWSWVSAYQLYMIQRELLTMAQTRAHALKKQVEYGSKPPIIIVDNQRLILERSAEETKAALVLQTAAYKLSLYHRDPVSHAPVIPKMHQATPLPPLPTEIELESLPVDERSALTEHPFLVAIRRDVNAKRVKLELAEAQYAPKLSAGAYVSQDLGEMPREQDKKLAAAELGLSLKLEVPIGLTTASAEVERGRAQLMSAQEKLRGLEDQLLTSLRSAHAALKADIIQARLAAHQVSVARELLAAERIKLSEGASDLVILNLRERAYTKAEASEVKATAHYHKSWANYISARGQRLSISLKEAQAKKDQSLE